MRPVLRQRHGRAGECIGQPPVVEPTGIGLDIFDDHLREPRMDQIAVHDQVVVGHGRTIDLGAAIELTAADIAVEQPEHSTSETLAEV